MTETLPQHPNGMRFSVFDKQGDMIATNEYYSVGGGFVVHEGTQFKDNAFFKKATGTKNVSEVGRKDIIAAPLPFRTAGDLLTICQEKNMSLADIVIQNELKWRTKEEIYSGLMVPNSRQSLSLPVSLPHLFPLLSRFSGYLEDYGQLDHEWVLVNKGVPPWLSRCQKACPQALQEAHGEITGLILTYVRLAGIAFLKFPSPWF